jgi:hypothetical protein
MDRNHTKKTATVNPFMETSDLDNPFMAAPSTNPFMEAPLSNDHLGSVKQRRTFFKSRQSLIYAVLVVLAVFMALSIPIYQSIQESIEAAQRIAELERQRQEEASKKKALIACNRHYAEKEMAQLSIYSNLIKANKEGSGDVYSTKQGTPTSTTYFDGDYATTYYHDGSYSSVDGFKIRYKIKNNSNFMIYKEITAKIIYYTKRGGFWSGLLGAAAGGAAAAKVSEDNNPLAIGAGAIIGSMAGRALLARNTEEFKIYPDLSPGQTYSGSRFISTSSGEDESDLKILTIRAEISESELSKTISPDCNN